MTEEERQLAAEIAAELGASVTSAAAPPASPSSWRPRLDAPASSWMLQSPGTAQQPGRRNFWGVGGVPGQANVIDIGFTSEFITGASDLRDVNRGPGAPIPNGLEPNELADHFNLRESELALGGYVDPFHRADVLLVWNAAEDEVAIEEGFLTFFNLPEGFRARVGKFRSRTGRANAWHLADMPWVTMPKVNQAFLGEEGFAQQGMRLTYIGRPQGRWSWSMDLEAFTGDSETLVDPTGLVSDPTGAGAILYDPDLYQDELIQSFHLQNHFQLSDTQDMEFGYSRLQANNDRVKMDGVDFTWRDLRQPGRNEWKLHFEGLRQTRDELLGSGNEDRGGYFAWLDRRFDRNNAAGVRVDYVEDLNPSGANNLKSWAAYWTYFPTEFSWYRLQYQVDEDTATGIEDKQVYLQFRWQIGVDRHALQ